MAESGGPPLGVGIIGAGPVTQAIHLPTLARLGDLFSVVAVMDVDPEIASAVAARAGATGMTDADALIADLRVEVVAICSPPQFHAAQVRAAIAAGKRAVLCEKPFAVSADEAAAIAAEARASRTPIVVGAMHTFDPVWREALAAVQGAGEVHTVRSTIVLPFNDRFEDWATQIHQRRTPPAVDASDPAVQDATMRNAVLGLAVHNLPHLRRFIGDVDAVTHAGLLDPFGYQVAVTGTGGATADLVGRMDRAWRTDWTFEAFGDDLHLKVSFPPSYVQAGSSTAALTVGRTTTVFGPEDRNGYEAEWRHLADLAHQVTEPLQPLDTVLDDLGFALQIADGAVAQLQQNRETTR